MWLVRETSSFPIGRGRRQTGKRLHISRHKLHVFGKCRISKKNADSGIMLLFSNKREVFGPKCVGVYLAPAGRREVEKQHVCGQKLHTLSERPFRNLSEFLSMGTYASPFAPPKPTCTPRFAAGRAPTRIRRTRGRDAHQPGRCGNRLCASTALKSRQHPQRQAAAWLARLALQRTQGEPTPRADGPTKAVREKHQMLPLYSQADDPPAPAAGCKAPRPPTIVEEPRQDSAEGLLGRGGTQAMHPHQGHRAPRSPRGKRPPTPGARPPGRFSARLVPTKVKHDRSAARATQRRQHRPGSPCKNKLAKRREVGWHGASFGFSRPRSPRAASSDACTQVLKRR